MKEIWKDVISFEGAYKVSNFGRVYSVRNDKILTLYKDKKGYMRVNLSYNGVRKNARVHRLVAQVFILNPNNYEQVNHKDEDKINNIVENLEWCDNTHKTAYGFTWKYL